MGQFTASLPGTSLGPLCLRLFRILLLLVTLCLIPRLWLPSLVTVIVVSLATLILVLILLILLIAAVLCLGLFIGCTVSEASAAG